MRRRKVTVVGAGNVGATTAQRIAEAGLADVVLVDIVEGLPQGKALDLAEAAPVVGHDARIIGTNDYADTADSDIVIVTSGLARQPGMSRDDLLAKNAGIVRAVVQQAAGPLPGRDPDHRHQSARRDVPRRLRGVGLSPRAGPGHGRRPRFGPLPVVHRGRAGGFGRGHPRRSCWAATATRWSPWPRYSTVAGVPITELLSPERVAALCERTANGGAEIVALLKTGSAFYAPAASTFEMVDAILGDRRRVLPCAILLQGEFRTTGLYVGVPADPRCARAGARPGDRAAARRAGRLRSFRGGGPGAGRQAGRALNSADEPALDPSPDGVVRRFVNAFPVGEVRARSGIVRATS